MALTVREALTQEQPRLLVLPGNPYVTHDQLEVAVASLLLRVLIWTTIRCPHTQVRNSLTVVAHPELVRALYEQECRIASALLWQGRSDRGSNSHCETG